MTTPTQILDHCKAVCEGKAKTATEADVKPHYDGGYIIERLGYFAIVKDGVNILHVERAAMLLGLDTPKAAPIVLEWVEKHGDTLVSRYNDNIKAVIGIGGVYVNNVYVIVCGDKKWMPYRCDITLAEAQSWCLTTITELVTQTKKA